MIAVRKKKWVLNSPGFILSANLLPNAITFDNLKKTSAKIGSRYWPYLQSVNEKLTAVCMTALRPS